MGLIYKNGVQYGGGGGQTIQYRTLPTASIDNLGQIVQYIGATTQTLTNGYYYECVSDGAANPTYSWEEKSVQAGGGDSQTTKNITSNTEVGGIASNTLIPEGTSITEFLEKLLVKEIAPTITFTASGSGVKEKGSTVTPTLTLNITNAGTGTPVSIKFYNGTTLLDTQNYVSGTNSYTYTLTDAISTDATVKGVLEYTKSDGTTSASLDKTASYTFVAASYYGAVSAVPAAAADVTSLTKSVKNTKNQTATFTLANQRSCYAYPASFGNLASIKDANNFEYLSSYTKTTLTIDSESYNIYTLTDPVTATGFKQIYS